MKNISQMTPECRKKYFLLFKIATGIQFKIYLFKSKAVAFIIFTKISNKFFYYTSH